ncbi:MULTISPECIES: hypothetical protein [Flavobacterium]|uniref:DRBM domain-containing protein n=1 Tax=Flavobacterium jumunjinense TaxID=998845 RepID=A0ABV5GUD4_9FLAO|nr:MULTISPECIES: hypothetical protein [Flavobacterium]
MSTPIPIVELASLCKVNFDKPLKINVTVEITLPNGEIYLGRGESEEEAAQYAAIEALKEI